MVFQLRNVDSYEESYLLVGPVMVLVVAEVTVVAVLVVAHCITE